MSFQRSASDGQDTYPGCCAVIRTAFVIRGVPEAAAVFMLRSIEESTINQYNTALKLWWEFCQKTNTSPFEYSVTRILSFFVNLLEKKSSYSTLNTYRAAISLIMDNELGKDIKISRVFRAIAIEKPQLPKYSAIWDPQLVLVYLESLYPNEEISLQNLTEKLVTLRALLTAHRVQTISLIKIENILVSENLI